MVTKNRGIRLKKHLDRDDQGHRTLLHVAYLEANPPGHGVADAVAEVQAPPPRKVTSDDRQLIRRVRRRALARQLREGLEDTLTLLDEALANIRKGGPA